MHILNFDAYWYVINYNNMINLINSYKKVIIEIKYIMIKVITIIII